MKKQILREAAIIYAANTVRNSLDTGAIFFNEKFTYSDMEYFQQVIKKIADGLSKKFAADVNECIEIAKNEN